MRNLVVVAALLLAACGSIETGHVGVRTQFGQVAKDVVQPGMYTAFVSHVDEYVAKEANIDLNNLTPKARDNLSLKEMDVTVYYRTNAEKIRDLAVKYAGQSQKGEAGWYPAFNVVANVARNVIYEEVAKADSLTIHTQRESMAETVRKETQAALDKNDPDTFTVTRVLIRAVVTDPTIEQSIQQAVAFQKNLESKKIQVQIAEQDALVRIAEANGLARAQGIINSTLTREYLQHEANEVMKKFAERKEGTNTVILPANSPMAPILNIK